MPIRFIHISDTHVGVGENFEVMGIQPFPFAKKIAQHIGELPFTPDFIIHTGDIVHEMPDVDNARAYQNVESLFAPLNIPFYYVTGNHDTSPLIKQHLTMGPKEELSKTLNTYAFERGDIRFVALDARGSDSIDPHGEISQEQINILENELRITSKQFIIFIHYPTLPIDSPWVDRDMLLLNGQRFHQTMISHADRILGVFSGHVHRGITTQADRITYTSVGSTCMQFNSFPGQETVTFQNDGIVRYNIVTVGEEGVIVKEQTF
jgi:Icc protein